MATITVRNLSEHVVEKLKARARLNGRSMEQEVREILESCTLDRSAVIEKIKASWDRQTRPTTAEEVNRWIREMRDREPL
jgi:plasmid stability protein